MKLLSLSLRHFRQHRETTLRFSEGLTAIVGANGSGKTTLVEAIAFALYGSRVVRGKVEDVKTRGAVKSAKTEVELVFEQDGRNYRIDRSLSDAKFFHGGDAQPVVSGTREVSARISSPLGMAYEEFLAAFFTEQKGLEFLSGAKGAAERERFVVRMMGYDRLERAQELLRAEKRDKRSEMSGREASLGGREELENRLRVEEAALQEISTKCESAARVLQEAEQKSTSARKAFSLLEEKRAAFEHKSLAIKEELVRLEEKLKRCKLLGAELQALPDPQALLAGDRSPAEQSARCAAQLSALAQQEQDIRSRGAEPEAGFREKLARCNASRDELKRRYEQVRLKQKSLGRLDKGGTCFTCGQELGEAFSRVKADIDREILDIEAGLDRSQTDEKSLAQPPLEIAALKKELKLVLERQAATKQELERLAGCERALENRRRVEKELLKTNEEVGVLRAQLGDLQAALQGAGFSLELFQREKGACEATEKLRDVARLQKVKIEGELLRQEALYSRTQHSLSAYEDKLAELESVKQRLLVLEESDSALTHFRKYLNASIRPRLAELASEFLTDLTDGRYTTVEVCADFSPTILDENGPRAVISGGEQDIVNLCMRLALSHMLVERSGQMISLLIMVEVFGSLDENRRNNVLGLLEKLGKRFEQIIVITHFDDLKDAVRNIIYVDYDDASGELRVSAEELESDLALNF